MPPSITAVEFEHLRKLKEKYGLQLPEIDAAIVRSEKLRKKLSDTLVGATPQNCGLVICGSLARSEMTASSDVDWTLLIDGGVSADHRAEANRIQSSIAGLLTKAPNPTGPFANLCFSHELVHAIGGAKDSNTNTTHRILLLLESRALSQPHIRDRVIGSILRRYFDPDSFSYKQPMQRDYFPRFLMNDVVRFWRTMAVDYAAKVAERDRREWAIRNAKLRFSRKLIFVAGILLSYETVLGRSDKKEDLSSDPSAILALIDRIQQSTQLAPQEALARALLRADDWAGAEAAARDIFCSYDAFLGIINNEESRDELARLDFNQAAVNPTFQRIRQLSVQFETGLNAYFWDGPEKVKILTRKYAIF